MMTSTETRYKRMRLSWPKEDTVCWRIMENSVSSNVSSRPSCSSTTPAGAHWDESDFTTAADVVPVRVPLERVEIGRHKYMATELGELELLYELESSSLTVNCTVSREDGTSPPSSFRITDISAADLSLATVIPGSLESMVARLMLETEEPVQYTVLPLQNPSQSRGTAKEERDSDETKSPGTKEGETLAVKTVHSRIVIMTASVHEAGHLRDVLLFLKGGYTGKVSPDAMFVNPNNKPTVSDETDTAVSVGKVASDPQEENIAGSITFLESLPVWSRYIPWWVYSRNVRISIQNILFLYSLFSVVWAFWQLYRNVDIIQHVLEPIIAVLKEVYFASIIEVFDWLLAVFTEFWMRFLSPLNILQALLLTPILHTAVQLKTVFLPLGRFLYYVLISVWQCLPNTQILASLKSFFLTVYGVGGVLGQLLWDVVYHLTKPVNLIWQGFLNSRIAVGSLDLNRLKLSWVVNLVVGSVKAISNGVAKLCGYTSRRRKLQMAKSHQYLSPVRQTRSSVHPLTPVYYSSPLSKASSM